MADVTKSLFATSALVVGASVVFAAGQPATQTSKSHPETHAPSSRPISATAIAPGAGHAHATRPANLPLRYDSKATFDNINHRDPNAEFLSWYGFKTESGSFSASCEGGAQKCGRWTTYAVNAIPLQGAGRTITTIDVPVYSYDRSYKFDVGIYSSVDGLPGEEIVGASTSGVSSLDCCALRTVTVPPTKLAKGTEYYLEVTPIGHATGIWLMEDTDFSSNQNDLFYYYETGTSCTRSYTQTSLHHTHTHLNCHTVLLNSGWKPSTSVPSEPAALVK